MSQVKAVICRTIETCAGTLTRPGREFECLCGEREYAGWLRYLQARQWVVPKGSSVLKEWIGLALAKRTMR
jgi:hypothetical protein